MLDVRHRVAQVVVLGYMVHGPWTSERCDLVKILSYVLIAFASREFQFQMLRFVRGWSSCTACSSYPSPQTFSSIAFTHSLPLTSYRYLCSYGFFFAIVETYSPLFFINISMTHGSKRREIKDCAKVILL